VSHVLGVDYGTKRIGLAISDGIGLTARPLGVVPRSELLETLQTLTEEHDIGLVVVGLPTGLRGQEGDSVGGARRLGTEISENIGVDVVYVDERFTSRMAENALLESGMKRRERRETVDKVAAAIILQTYLDSRRSAGNSPDDPGVEAADNQ
jgi:putative Holliday junction resolvase